MVADYEKRSWLYVDGFNFYYAIKNSDLPKGLAWCDLRSLGEQYLIREGSKLERIRYFTAPVKQYSVEYGSDKGSIRGQVCS